MGAAITYSNNSKHELVDASLSTIDRYGAVSEQTAREMAYGTSLRFDCPLSASVTGIAGPNGGSDSKPVGTVHIATVFHGEIRHHEHHFKGDRHSIRKQATEAAIDMLLKALKA